MSIISHTISNMFGGMSQQPPQLRSDSQCDFMVNCWPDVAVGLTRRPPSEHVAKLSTDADTNRFVHFIHRDGAEKYAVFLKSGTVKVYDLITGAEKTVTTPDGTTYLTSSSPKDDFAALTIADTTFIVNKTKTVTLDAAGDSAPTPNTVWYVHVKTTVISTVYNIVLPGLTANYNTPSTVDSTTTIAGNLRGTIDAHADYVAEVSGSVIKITRADGTAFTCTTTDGYGDQAMIAFSDSVESAAELPVNFWTGKVIKVRGGLNESADDYYVHFADGAWKETVAPGLQNSITDTTMPHKLVRNSDGTFTLSKITWVDRVTGDADSSPAPSFIGQKINGLFFYRERLGLLSGENVVMSRVSDYYNFFPTSATAVTDDDPIDVTVSDTRVTTLLFGVPFQESILLFSDSAQHRLSGGDIMSPKTVTVDTATRFNVASTVAPVAAGRDVYFAVNRGEYTSLREFFVLADGINTDAADVTAHVPTVWPKDTRHMAVSSALDLLLLTSDSMPFAMGLYKYLWDGEKKVQSAWGTILLQPDVTLLGMTFIDTALYMLIRRADGTYIEKMEWNANGVEWGEVWDSVPYLPFRVHLDRRYKLVGGYDPVLDKTTWTLPYADTENNYEVVLGTNFGTKSGTLIKTTKTDTTTIQATGNYAGSPVFVGKTYSTIYQFSELYLKDRDNVALLAGRLSVRSMAIDYTNSLYFRAEVTPKLRDKATYVFTGALLGTSSATIGQVTPSSGQFRFPVITENRGLTVQLINDSPFPSTFQSATWEGSYVTRSRRA